VAAGVTGDLAGHSTSAWVHHERGGEENAHRTHQAGDEATESRVIVDYVTMATLEDDPPLFEIVG
jgi:hypothetical protein